MNVKYALVLGIVAFISATILSATYFITKKPIASAYREDFLEGLRGVLPEFDNQPDTDAIVVDGRKIYLARMNGEIIAFAAQGTSLKGYGGQLALIVGADVRGKIIGVQITQHSETPGLGDRVKRPSFIANFIDQSIDTRFFVTRDGGTVDQISGATMSSRAVTSAVNDALDLFEGNVEVQQ